MCRLKPRIEGEIQGDLTTSQLFWIMQEKGRDCKGPGGIGAGSQNASEGASKPLKRGTQPPLGINVKKVSWFQKAGTLTSCSTQR